MGAFQGGGEGNAKLQLSLGKEAPGAACLSAAEIRQRDVGGAGESVGKVPFALSVADEHKQTFGQDSFSVLRPSTSAIV